MKNLATILHFKSRLSGKFQRFNTIDGSIEKFQLKWKIVKRGPKFYYGDMQKYTGICFQSN